MQRIPSACLAATLGLACVTSAQAIAIDVPSVGVTFAWGLDAESSDTQTFSYVSPGASDQAWSTGGLRTASAGNVNATVNAWVNPVTGVFKSANTATTGSATRPADIAQSYARLDVTDVLRVSGPGATAAITFRMSYDTVFSGLGLSPFDAGDLASHFMQADSSRYASLTYQVPNPAYDPNAECTGSGEMFECGVETMAFFTERASADKTLFREWAQSERGFVYSNGDVDNGRYTGELLLSMVVPTNVDLTLNYTVYHGARCFHLSNCSVGVDASQSDYIGLELGEGQTFTSAAGYRYEGLAAAVPEPSSLGLMLAGLLGMGAVARRKARAA
jgi:PEP-CTERM motif